MYTVFFIVIVYIIIIKNYHNKNTGILELPLQIHAVITCTCVHHLLSSPTLILYPLYNTHTYIHTLGPLQSS